jgi:hypothetical protein
MSRPDRVLIVANQTLGGAALDRVIQDRIAAGQRRFHIVVPMIPPAMEAVAWGGAEVGFVIPAPDSDSIEQSRQRSEHRLEAIVRRIEAAGGSVTGEVGDTDPAYAVKRVLETDQFVEIIVSTLPAGISRWLRMDLPSRVARMTEIPVTTVEAED